MSGSDPAAVASGSDLMTSGSDLVVVLATGHVLWFVALLSHGVEHSVHRTATEPGVIVCVHSTGEESAAVVFGRVAALPHGGGTGEAVQLLGGAAQPVSRVRVLAVSSPAKTRNYWLPV